jgi:uncharacterized protein YbaR (Trm112 family)
MVDRDSSQASSIIPDDFLAMLRCVNNEHSRDDGVLRISGKMLECTVCGYAYKVENGIPNMLWDEAIPPNGETVDSTS